ncbi:unnamed protein product [Schistosoma margrebowiei]|uniref:Uncharacterized protein n=1 Tax=Schistosoma margrebowiei TaxID=48269 RepID=A0A183MQC5_9TREM|nr:unnamed protein product [Schistosoma margrebowiei]
MISTKEINKHDTQRECNQQFEIYANNNSMMYTLYSLFMISIEFQLNGVMHSKQYNMMKHKPNENALHQIETIPSMIDDITNALEQFELNPSYFCLDYEDEIYYSEFDYNLDS